PPPPPLRASPAPLAASPLVGRALPPTPAQPSSAGVRAARPRRPWPAEIGGLLAALPGYLRADKRDRSELIRLVNRRYKGYRSEDLRALMQGEAGRRIRASIRPEALETIERHRAAGHRTVLVSGALDVLVEPL